MTTPETQHALCLARALRRHGHTAETLAPRLAMLREMHLSPVCK